jgi:hypothetical protein
MVEKETVVTPNNEVEETTEKTEPITEEVKVQDPAPQQTDKVEEKEKVFTQAQLDEIVVARLSKEKMRMLKKLGINDETQLDEVVDKYKNYDNVLEQATTLKMEKELRTYKDALSELDVDKDFTEYVLSKIEKGENLEAFKENAKQFLEANPKFKTETFQKVNSSLNLGGKEAYPDFNQMTTEQYLRWREKNKL